jgi:hypothetical protein
MQIPDYLPNLPPAVTREVFAYLCATLPLSVLDNPDQLADRNEAAVAALAALRPGDAFEARLAAQIVAADAHVIDCLRQAAQRGQTPEEVRRCRAQAATMMRCMQSSLRQLKRDQAIGDHASSATRQAAMDRAIHRMRHISVPAAKQASPPNPTEHAPAEYDLAAEAGRYARAHPKRALLIRRLGGLPARLNFGPLRPELVAAIVASADPLVRAFDTVARRTRSAA